MGLKKAFGQIVDKLTRSERARNRSAKKHEESAARRRGPGITINEPDPVPRRVSVSYQPPAAAYETPSSGDEAQSDDGVEYMVQERARTPAGKAIIDEEEIDDSDQDDDENQDVPPGYNAEMGGPSSSQPRMDYTGLGTGYYHDDHGSSSGGFQQHRDHDYADAWAPDMGGGYPPPNVPVGDPIWDEQLAQYVVQHQDTSSARWRGSGRFTGAGVGVSAPEETYDQMRRSKRPFIPFLNEPAPGGPDIPEFFRSWPLHFAHDIYVGKERKSLDFQYRQSMLHTWPIPIMSPYFRAAEEAGLVHLPSVLYRHVNEGLVSAFIERWNPETNSFHLPTGEMSIGLHDVKFQMHLRIAGKSLGVPIHLSVKGKKDVLQQKLKDAQNALGIPVDKGGCSHARLREQAQHADRLEIYSRAFYLVGMVSKLIFV